MFALLKIWFWDCIQQKVPNIRCILGIPIKNYLILSQRVQRVKMVKNKNNNIKNLNHK